MKKENSLTPPPHYLADLYGKRAVTLFGHGKMEMPIIKKILKKRSSKKNLKKNNKPIKITGFKQYDNTTND